jgi:hypothetical protein
MPAGLGGGRRIAIRQRIEQSGECQIKKMNLGCTLCRCEMPRTWCNLTRRAGLRSQAKDGSCRFLTSSGLDPIQPVARPSLEMSDGEDPDLPLGLHEDQSIRKAG